MSSHSTRALAVVGEKARSYMHRHPGHPGVRAVSRCADAGVYLEAWRAYRRFPTAIDKSSRRAENRAAVVAHVYYLDRWPALLSALSDLHQVVPFDLFVTFPPGPGTQAQAAREAFPQAFVAHVPNLGRDVLPFMRIAPLLETAGYRYVLKIHSKKSPHHPDPDKWFADMLDNLAPADATLANQLLSTLEDPATGMIGPGGQYVSLRAYIDENLPVLRRELERLTSPGQATQVLSQLSIGFFAGTMFWARLDALAPLLHRHYRLWAYDPEQGRINGTLAHTLERLFTVVPALNGRRVYEVGPDGLRLLDLSQAPMPWWWATTGETYSQGRRF